MEPTDEDIAFALAVPQRARRSFNPILRKPENIMKYPDPRVQTAYERGMGVSQIVRSAILRESEDLCVVKHKVREVQDLFERLAQTPSYHPDNRLAFAQQAAYLDGCIETW